MSQIVLYICHNTPVLSFYRNVVYVLSTNVVIEYTCLRGEITVFLSCNSCYFDFPTLKHIYGHVDILYVMHFQIRENLNVFIICC